MAGEKELGQVVHCLSITRRQLLDDLVHFVGRNTHAEVPLSLWCSIEDQDGAVAIKPVLMTPREKLLMRIRPRVPYEPRRI